MVLKGERTDETEFFFLGLDYEVRHSTYKYASLKLFFSLGAYLVPFTILAILHDCFYLNTASMESGTPFQKALTFFGYPGRTRP